MESLVRPCLIAVLLCRQRARLASVVDAVSSWPMCRGNANGAPKLTPRAMRTMLVFWLIQVLREPIACFVVPGTGRRRRWRRGASPGIARRHVLRLAHAPPPATSARIKVGGGLVRGKGPVHGSSRGPLA